MAWSASRPEYEAEGATAKAMLPAYGAEGATAKAVSANTIVEAIRVTWTANADAKIAGVLPAISKTQWCG